MRAYVIWETPTGVGHDIFESADALFLTEDALCVRQDGDELRYPWTAYKSLLGGMYNARPVEVVR